MDWSCMLTDQLLILIVNLISFLLQFVNISLWSDCNQIMFSTLPVIVSCLELKTSPVQQTWLLGGRNARNGEVLLEFQNKHCQVDT